MKLLKRINRCVFPCFALVLTSLTWPQARSVTTAGGGVGTDPSVPKYASQFQWNQSPTMPPALAKGKNTVTLSPCPKGFMVAPYPEKRDGIPSHEYIYVSGTGTPEAARIHGISGHAGDVECSFEIALNGEHSKGYRVGTATGGIKEASEDATILAEPYGFGSRRKQGGTVVLDVAGSPYNVYAPLYIEATSQIILGAGGTIDCYVADDDCVKVGDENANHFLGIQLEHLRFHPNIVKGTKSALYVNANGTSVHDITTLYSSTGGTFGHIVTVCDDQAFTLDGLNYIGVGLRGDKDFVGSAVYAPGPFNTCSAVGWLRDMQISAQCGGNGVDWRSGNSLHVSDSVIQGFLQFGIRTGTMRGGYSPTQLDHLYMEVGSCRNPVGNIGQAGIISVGSWVNGKTDMLAIGQQPTYAKGGSKHYIYWIVARDSKRGSSVPLRVGDANANGKEDVVVAWPRIDGNNITYDVLRTEGEGNAVTAPYGTGAYAIATGVPQCIGEVCTTTNHPSPPVNYSVVDNPSFTPELMFWPGSLILSNGATAVVTVPPVTNVSPVISTAVNVPSLFADFCPGGTPGVYAVCLAGDSFGNNQSRVVGTLLQNGPASGGMTANLKGRLNFMQSPAGGLTPGHVMTLVDSNPAKTLADSVHRPSNDDNDTFIGLDVPAGGASVRQAQLSIGAPVSISEYVGNKGDGINWKERLTTKEKTFAVPVTIKSGSTFTLGGGSALSQMKLYSSRTVPASVPPQSCLNVMETADGLTVGDLIVGINPPKPLGSLSLNAYVTAAGTLTLHFCNPTAGPLLTPAGAYSYLAVH